MRLIVAGFIQVILLTICASVGTSLPAGAQNIEDCSAYVHNGQWDLATEACGRILSILLTERQSWVGSYCETADCDHPLSAEPDLVTKANNEMAYSIIAEAEAAIAIHNGHLNLAEFWLDQALTASKDLAAFPPGRDAIVFAMRPTARSLVARQTAERQALKDRIAIVASRSSRDTSRANHQAVVSNAPASAKLSAKATVSVPASATTAFTEHVRDGITSQTWDGVIIDARGGRGDLTLAFVTGTFRDTFGKAGSNYGDITDVRHLGASSVSFSVRSAIQPSCVYAVKAQVGSNGQLVGTYSGCGNNTGTFTLSPSTIEVARIELPAGTPVSVIGDGRLSSANAQLGEQVTIYALEDVRINDWVAISKCAAGRGTVVFVQRADSSGHAGELGISMEWIESVGGEHVGLTGQTINAVGAAKAGAASTMSVLSRVLGLPLTIPVKGGDVTLDENHPLQVYTSQILELARNVNGVPDAATPQPGECGSSPASDDATGAAAKESTAPPTAAPSAAP